MATKTTKTTKKSTKTAATRTAKKPVAKKTAGRAACKTTKKCRIDETSRGHCIFCAVLCVCCAMTAMITAAVFIGAKASADALEANLEADRNRPTETVEYSEK